MSDMQHWNLVLFTILWIH